MIAELICKLDFLVSNTLYKQCISILILTFLFYTPRSYKMACIKLEYMLYLLFLQNILQNPLVRAGTPKYNSIRERQPVYWIKVEYPSNLNLDWSNMERLRG